MTVDVYLNLKKYIIINPHTTQASQATECQNLGKF